MADLEVLTQAIGRQLLADARPTLLNQGTSRWADDRLMDWGMRHEALKVQLFQFVDVLPSLGSDQRIWEHLRAYLQELRPQLPPAVHGAANWILQHRRAGQSAAKVAQRVVGRLARRMIAAADVDQAPAAVAGLRARKLAATVDLLGEAVRSEREACHYQQLYLRLISVLAEAAQSYEPLPLLDTSPQGPLPAVHVSLKLSALHSQFDPADPAGTAEVVMQRLRPILRAARQHRALVNVDMEQRQYKDLTLHIFRSVLMEPEFVDWADVGVVLQSYLPETEDDLRSLHQWVVQRPAPIWVRLVKGAYWDYETVICAQNGWPLPVYAHKHQTDAAFERHTRFLLERYHQLRPAIASHNVRSVAHALAFAQHLKLPPGALEFQVLHGMAQTLAAALVQRGQRVRIYTPVGQLLPGMAYLVRRLLENTSNQSFLRAMTHAPPEVLLMNPADISSPSAAPVSSDGCEFHNEPPADFSLASNRQAMQQALQGVASQLGADYPLVIGGRSLNSDAWIESVDPSHQRVLVGRSAAASAQQAQEAVAAAKAALAGWRDRPVEQRCRLLEQTADVLASGRFELAAWEVCETAKQWREADADVAEAIDYCRYYARQMRQIERACRQDVPGEHNELFYEARGVAAVIAPWNFPLAILCGMTAAALVTGNTVVMKPAEQSVVMGAKLMEAFAAAGLPPGVVNYLPGIGQQVGPVLVSHPDVATIAFTGSRAVGLAIHELAARSSPDGGQLKHVICEMGGKNAIIVDSDADMDEAIAGMISSAFGYAGQKCSACSRVIVLQDVYQTLLARLIEAAASMRIGPAKDPGCLMGPVIDQQARESILRYIEIGRREAPLVWKGDTAALDDEGFYVAPHIFAPVPPDARIANEEIFGPVLAILRAADITEALRLANGTPYGLTGGLYSRNPQIIQRVRREFRVGNLYINRRITGALVGRQPFGGLKMSGGATKAGGPDYLLHFLLPRTITENVMRRGYAPQEGGQ